MLNPNKAMTVKELIETLEKLNLPDAKIVLTIGNKIMGVGVGHYLEKIYYSDSYPSGFYTVYLDGQDYDGVENK